MLAVNQILDLIKNNKINESKLDSKDLIKINFYKNKLNEEVYKNYITAYHRTSDIKKWWEWSEFESISGGKGDMYGKGFYMNYNFDSVDSEFSHLNYGDYVVKCIVKTKNIIYFDYDNQIKLFGKAMSIKDQFDYWGIEYSNSIIAAKLIKSTFFTTVFSKSDLTSDLALKFVKLYNGNAIIGVNGISYSGYHDGKCVVLYNNDNLSIVGYYEQNKRGEYKYISKEHKLHNKTLLAKSTSNPIHYSTGNEEKEIIKKLFPNIKFKLNKGGLDIEGDVIIDDSTHSDVTKITFGKINGNFITSNCTKHELVSIPHEVTGDFISDNASCFKSLQDVVNIVVGGDFSFKQSRTEGFFNKCHIRVGGNMDCERSVIENIEGCHIKVNGNLSFAHNSINSLKDVNIEVSGNLSLMSNSLTTLRFYDNIKVGGNLDCSYNMLTNLKGYPTEVGGSYIFDYNYITDITDFDKDIINNLSVKAQTSLVEQFMKTINGVKSYTQNGDGSVDCVGNINFRGRNLGMIPIKFRIVKGDFNCSFNNLMSLENAPSVVTGDFNCSHNHLIDLKDAPKKVSGVMDCQNNEITSLKGCPSKVKSFNCSNNKLTSLKWCPNGNDKIVDFDCSYNQITNLKDCPSISESFNCQHNEITSLEYSPIEAGLKFYCDDNKITSIENIPLKNVFIFSIKRNPLINHNYSFECVTIVF